MVHDPEVDAFFEKAPVWADEMRALRAIAQGFPLTEVLKWSQPVYTLDGANVAIIGAFKEYCCISFFKGSLLPDPEGLLIAPGKNTRVGRLLKLTTKAQITTLEPQIRRFLAEAIATEKAGHKVDYSANRTPDIPEELKVAFAEVAGLEAAFRALTPGRQRGYTLHFTGAKQTETRMARVTRCVSDILAGRGFNGR